jgi:LysM repeat protein
LLIRLQPGDPAGRNKMNLRKNNRSLLIAAIILLGIGTISIFAVILWLSGGKLAATVPPTSTPAVVLPPTMQDPTKTPTVQPTSTPEPTATYTITPILPASYIVSAGDTLSGIAVKFQLSLDALIAANALTGTDIQAGQILIIPIAASTPNVSTTLAANEYLVKNGDTLEVIAALVGTTVEKLRVVNFMYGDAILPEQKLFLPVANPIAPVWTWSVLEGNRTTGYPNLLDKDKFTLRFQGDSFASIDPEAVVGLVQNALNNVQTIFGIDLNGRFTAYAAGTLFEPPNQHLRGRSFSSARETLFLYDGTGDPADQQYIIAHELTHLYMWNTFGVPSSVMLSEGAAVYSGMNAISTSDHLLLNSICKLLYDAGSLPNVAKELGYSGHNYDMENYYTSGCFVGYLLEKYSPSKVGEVYPNSSYVNIFGRSLVELEHDFESSLASQPAIQGIDPVAFSNQMEKVSNTYRSFFPAFSPAAKKLEEYRLLDHARLELLKGNLAESDQYLVLFSQR